jgi:hypothetical protein
MWKNIEVSDFFKTEKENGYRITAKGEMFSGGFYYESGTGGVSLLRAEITKLKA